MIILSTILFSKLCEKRNRIIHSFRITSTNNKQYYITEELLMEFIEMNENLSRLLHDFRRH